MSGRRPGAHLTPLTLLLLFLCLDGSLGGPGGSHPIAGTAEAGDVADQEEDAGEVYADGKLIKQSSERTMKIREYHALRITKGQQHGDKMHANDECDDLKLLIPEITQNTFGYSKPQVALALRSRLASNMSFTWDLNKLDMITTRQNLADLHVEATTEWRDSVYDLINGFARTVNTPVESGLFNIYALRPGNKMDATTSFTYNLITLFTQFLVFVMQGFIMNFVTSAGNINAMINLDTGEGTSIPIDKVNIMKMISADKIYFFFTLWTGILVLVYYAIYIETKLSVVLDEAADLPWYSRPELFVTVFDLGMAAPLALIFYFLLQTVYNTKNEADRVNSLILDTQYIATYMTSFMLLNVLVSFLVRELGTSDGWYLALQQLLGQEISGIAAISKATVMDQRLLYPTVFHHPSFVVEGLQRAFPSFRKWAGDMFIRDKSKSVPGYDACANRNILQQDKEGADDPADWRSYNTFVANIFAVIMKQSLSGEEEKLISNDCRHDEGTAEDEDNRFQGLMKVFGPQVWREKGASMLELHKVHIPSFMLTHNCIQAMSKLVYSQSRIYWHCGNPKRLELAAKQPGPRQAGAIASYRRFMYEEMGLYVLILKLRNLKRGILFDTIRKNVKENFAAADRVDPQRAQVVQDVQDIAMLGVRGFICREGHHSGRCEQVVTKLDPVVQVLQCMMGTLGVTMLLLLHNTRSARMLDIYGIEPVNGASATAGSQSAQRSFTGLQAARSEPGGAAPVRTPEHDVYATEPSVQAVQPSLLCEEVEDAGGAKMLKCNPL